MILFLFLIVTFSKKFSLKIINTPIYNSIPVFPLHSVVLLYDDLNTFAIDFSPFEDITSPKTIIKLLQGKQIQGKLRLNNFSQNETKYLKNNKIFKNFDNNLTDINLKKLENIDSDIISIIKLWGSSFQIYKRNCRNFSYFLKKQYLEIS